MVSNMVRNRPARGPTGRRAAPRRLLLPACVLGLGAAHAAAPVTAAPALATAAVTGAHDPAAHDDVTRTVLIGPSGQIYDPVEATPGTWRRRTNGGVSAAVTGAVLTDEGALFVSGARAPLFRFDAGAWHVHPLPNRGPSTLPTDGAPAAAIGAHVYTWRNQGWARLRSTRDPVTAIWAATDGRVYVATRAGTIQSTGPGGWRSIHHPLPADDPVVLLSGRAGKQQRVYAVARSGALLRLDAHSATPIPQAPELSGFAPQAAATAPDGELWVAGVLADTAGTTADDAASPARAVLAQTVQGTLRMVEPLPAPAPGERFAILRVGPGGALLVATSGGVVRYRIPGRSAGQEAAGWQIGTLIGELPMPHSAFPGREPAHMR